MLLRFTLLLCASLTIMSGATLAPSLPQIAEVFKDVPQIDLLSRWIVTLPALFIGLAAPLSGWLIDRYGRLPFLYAALLAYALFGCSGLWLEDLYAILLGRAGLGLAVAFNMTATNTLIGDHLKGPKLTGFLSFQAFFIALGGVFFIGLGGILANWHWRAPFGIYALSLALLPLCFLVFGWGTEGTGDWRKNLEAEQAAEAEAGLGLAPWPLIFSIYFIVFWQMVAFFTLPIQLPFVVKALGIADNFWGALSIAACTISGALMALNYRRLRGYLAFSQIYMAMFGVMGLGFMGLAWADSYWELVFFSALTGLGLGIGMPNTSTYLLSLAPAAVRGRILGGMTFAVFSGQFASPLVVTWLGGNASNLQGAFLPLGFLLWILVPLAWASARLKGSL